MALSSDHNLQSICEDICLHYSACDISDALLKLHVHQAGFLPDFATILTLDGFSGRIVAPVSTAVLIPTQWTDVSSLPPHFRNHTSILPGQNWTDCVDSGTVVLIQQPREHVSAILGDIMVTRLQQRGIVGVVADGRLRDMGSCATISRQAGFQIWFKGVSAAGPSLEAKPWAVNVPLQVGGVWVSPGDILCADQEDKVVVVIPRDRLDEVYEMLSMLKRASDGVMTDVKNGLSLPEAVQRHPNFYSNYK